MRSWFVWMLLFVFCGGSKAAPLANEPFCVGDLEGPQARQQWTFSGLSDGVRSFLQTDQKPQLFNPGEVNVSQIMSGLDRLALYASLFFSLMLNIYLIFRIIHFRQNLKINR